MTKLTSVEDWLNYHFTLYKGIILPKEALARVDEHVVLENVRVGETLAALGTNKRSVICVGPLVALTSAIVDIGAFAKAALELASPGVHHLVSFQLARG